MSNQKPSSRLNVLLSNLQDHYSLREVTEFLEECIFLALKRPEFFCDVRTGVCDIFYFTEGKHLEV